MEYWVATQRALQGGDAPLVTRPKLTDALLRRPPFRFLHDIVSEVTRQTGFAKDLFSGTDLVSTSLKDKDGKVGYLNKIINCVGITLGAHVPARPLKIVAGLEPEQTNTFLQMLAAATTVDETTRHNAVVRTLAGGSMPPASKGSDSWIARLQTLVASRQSAVRKNPVPTDASRSRSPPVAPAAANVVAAPPPPQAAKAEIAPPKPCVSPTRKTTGPSESLKACLAPEAVKALLEPQEAAAAAPNAPAATKVSTTKPTRDGYGAGGNRLGSASGGGTRDPYAEILELRKPSSRKREQMGSGGGARRDTGGGSRAREGSERGHTPLGGGPDILSELLSPYEIMEQHLRPPPGLAPLYTNTPRDGGQVRRSKLKDDDKAAAGVAHQQQQQQLQAAGGSDHGGVDAVTTEEEPQEVARPGTPPLPSCMVPHVERPQSARLGPPRLPSNLLPADMRGLGGGGDRPASAAAGKRGDIKKPNILRDDADAADDDDDETEPVLIHGQPPSSLGLHEAQRSVAEAGKLVRDILETKRELAEEGTGTGAEAAARAAHTKGGPEEVQRLRAAVQKLCQGINPLGKCVDNLQEGMQSMAKEYQHWIREHERYSAQLQKERRVTESMVQAEAGRVAELEEEIRRQQQRIGAAKAQSLRYEGKIMSMLRMVTTRPSINS